ncbi:MAG TPA: PilN domain-containing protein [Casimicrobiaceae bacterium]|nr:PilN domain-containing protein [Casimicrobiaceae bacterium]
MSAVGAHARELMRRLGLAGFGRWWAQELWTFVPAPVRGSLERRRARPVLAFDGKVATLWRPQVNGRLQMVEASKIPLDGGEGAVVAAGRTALAAVGRPGAATTPVIVALPPRAVLRKSLTLPAAIEADLRPALAYDLDRHTPFKAEDLYFDAVVVDRDATGNTLTADLVAARRALVDPMLRHAESFGAVVTAVVADPPERAATSRVNLLPDERRSATPAWTRWQVILPAVLLVVLAVVALVLPLWQKRQEAIALNRVSEGARHRAEASDALRTELERKTGDYNFALQRKYEYPGTVQVLDDVTRILPDDTWLTQLEFHTGRGKDAMRTIVLRGESANAGRLVALLQDSKLFTQAAPRSPTTKIQPGPGEIFDVGAQIVAARAPRPRPLDVTAREVAALPAAARPAPVAAGTGVPRAGAPIAAQAAPQAVPQAAQPSQPAPPAAPPPALPAQAPAQVAPATAQPAGPAAAQGAFPAAQAPPQAMQAAPPTLQAQPPVRAQPSAGQRAPDAPSQFGPLPPGADGNPAPEGQ